MCKIAYRTNRSVWLLLAAACSMHGAVTRADDPMQPMMEPATPPPPAAEVPSAPSATTPAKEPLPAAPANDAPLAGPAVPEQKTLTLVQHDAKGSLIRVNGRPEIAAAGLLDLDADARKAVRAAETQRLVDISVLLVERFDDTCVLTDAIAANKRDDARPILKSFAMSLGVITADGLPVRMPLASAIDASLSPSQRAQVRTLVDEYFDAMLGREFRNRKQPPSDEDRAKAELRVAQQIFESELRAAYDQSIKPYRERLDRMMKELDPTPEQRESARGIVIEYLRASRLKPTLEQRQDVMGKLYRLLDEERRARLFELVVTQSAGGMW
jgi:hypothetical protein